MGYAYRKVGYEDLTYKKKAKVKSKEFGMKKLAKHEKNQSEVNHNINSILKCVKE